jgi:hypothetical protein
LISPKIQKGSNDWFALHLPGTMVGVDGGNIRIINSMLVVLVYKCD